jgi:hypothetical protein
MAVGARNRRRPASAARPQRSLASSLSRLAGWLLLDRHPRGPGDYLLLVSLPLLALLAALLLAWPWLTSDADGQVSTVLDLGRTALTDWGRRLLDGGQWLVERLPRPAW